ncbi:virulence factor BrkB family protein [Alteromonas macleodii]|uniref:virulence factor BrkB family protein n=1 Tax=Alteromonas TaxID=226 RepID=UPI000286F9EA|nr:MULTISPECIES: virulence factor BrkB family protein [Alteromonas]MAW02467.1 YihY/virulence factor BrkB family protein [Alteromonas sp.]MCG7638958.1 virulence factor BrkB family protein [Alteromonas sp. CNT1-28]MCG7645785.1 virulence factor BrkB family protein [Alteromonas sp. Cnat3-28]MCG7811206.1 virulence factor BrkB family protein [Alteromonas sp. MCA-1]MCG8495403.1 virulence factor BrkB family protein [Enterobacterales bacterium]MEC7453157.1 virulence factor BrkB family protein [Pseudom
MDLDKVKALYNNVTPQVRDLFSIFIKRCREDNITISAGHLAYVTLLSLVPFIMVTFTIMSAFPAFASVRSKLEHFVFSNFVPTASDVVHKYMTDFVGNASQMSAIGILSLLVVALMLISNVDKTLNRIWRTQSDRPIVYTFAIYWMVITLGPMLIGSSVVVSSYLTGLAAFTEEYTPGLGTFLLSLVPSGAAMLAFTILYMVVPNRRVFARHALVGAIVATIAFEITKSGFALYVTNFPSYELIYGALAVVPILFLWVYLSWIIVLFGAEFTCSLGEAFENRKAENEPRKVPQE